MRTASLIGFWVSSLAALAGFFLPWFVTTETTTITLKWSGTSQTSSSVEVRKQSGFQRMLGSSSEYRPPALALTAAAVLVVMASMSSLGLSILSTVGSAPVLGTNLRSLALSGCRWLVPPLALGAVAAFWIECLSFSLFEPQRFRMTILFVGENVNTRCSLTPWFWVTGLFLTMWFGFAAAYGFIPGQRAGSLTPVKRRTSSDDAR